MTLNLYDFDKLTIANVCQVMNYMPFVEVYEDTNQIAWSNEADIMDYVMNVSDTTMTCRIGFSKLTPLRVFNNYEFLRITHRRFLNPSTVFGKHIGVTSSPTIFMEHIIDAVMYLAKNKRETNAIARCGVNAFMACLYASSVGKTTLEITYDMLNRHIPFLVYDPSIHNNLAYVMPSRNIGTVFVQETRYTHPHLAIVKQPIPIMNAAFYLEKEVVCKIPFGFSSFVKDTENFDSSTWYDILHKVKKRYRTEGI